MKDSFSSGRNEQVDEYLSQTVSLFAVMRRAACCCGKQLDLINSTTVSVTIYVRPAASDDS